MIKSGFSKFFRDFSQQIVKIIYLLHQKGFLPKIQWKNEEIHKFSHFLPIFHFLLIIQQIFIHFQQIINIFHFLPKNYHHLKINRSVINSIFLKQRKTREKQGKWWNLVFLKIYFHVCNHFQASLCILSMKNYSNCMNNADVSNSKPLDRKMFWGVKDWLE